MSATAVSALLVVRSLLIVTPASMYSSMFQEQNDLEIKIWIKDNEGEVKVIPHLRRAIRFDG